MKYFYVGLFILALLLSGCFLSGLAVSRRTEAVALPLEQAISSLGRGDEAGGARYARLARTEWERSEGLLASLLNHEPISAIGGALAELEELHGEALAAGCRQVIRAVRALARSETLRWRNLF